MYKQVIYTLLLFYCWGCKNIQSSNNSVTPAFYHWKTSFNPSQYETNMLQQNNVKHIYLRFFDVAWDATFSKPTPIAQVRITDTSFKKSNTQIIPTVFITNECIHYIRPEQCRPLAENIYKLVSDVIATNNIDSIKEVQIDCDWTATTKEKYFTILSELQKIDTAHLYSATIRLFQVKYAAESGIPPVKKGLLMCYNMGNLKSPAAKNSILNPEEVKKYTASLDKYPLPLDVALPLFQWFVLFRQGAYAGLVQNISVQEIKKISKETSTNRFEIINDTSLRNVNLKKRDILRLEDCSYNNIIQTASILKQKLSNENRRLVLYHLDSLTLSKYSAYEIESIFYSLH